MNLIPLSSLYQRKIKAGLPVVSIQESLKMRTQAGRAHLYAKALAAYQQNRQLADFCLNCADLIYLEVEGRINGRDKQFCLHKNGCLITCHIIKTKSGKIVLLAEIPTKTGQPEWAYLDQEGNYLGSHPGWITKFSSDHWRENIINQT